LKTRVTLHRFTSDPTLPQRDGVNLAHTEINDLLLSPQARHISVSFHDFDRLLRDEPYARDELGSVDCVLSNVGPHAHYYHLLRDRLKLRFRIVRDIKTALWSCYLLQESLCQPLLRPGDVLLATSNYSRVLTRHLFPHLQGHPIALFEPVLSLQPFAPQTKSKYKGAVITLGHIGRLSKDKNFDQMIDLLLALHRQEPGRYRLVACGSVHSTEYEPNAVARRIYLETGRNDLFTYLRPVAHEKIVELLQSFDYFLFFSTSNLEVLGRVLVECAYAGTPVLTGQHAAAPELVDTSSLLPVAYTAQSPFHSHFDLPLGRVDIEAAALKILNRLPVQPAPVPRVNRPEVLFDALGQTAGPFAVEADPALHEGPADFINRLRWQDLGLPTSSDQALESLEELRDWFCALNGQKSADTETRLQRLRSLSRFTQRTERYLQTTGQTRGDFTNLGGMDMELCNVAKFHPSFWFTANVVARSPSSQTQRETAKCASPLATEGHDFVQGF
jgi:glycosyltransferase involved in cell wall biosynthesis